jgi:phosphohistidine phosphatase
MTRASEDHLLILLRHAKTEQVPGKPDHERELTKRGRRDAQAAGVWLAGHGIGFDLVLVSSSARTMQTADEVASSCAEAEVWTDRRLYAAPPDRLLEVIHEADPEAGVVLVVGHAPGIPALASLLADGQGSVLAHARMAEGYPTCALAVLSYSGHWSDLGFDDARLEYFAVPRG